MVDSPNKQKTNKETKEQARRAYKAEFKRKKHRKSSSTAGSTKNPDTCQASNMDKYFAKSSRSYKHPGYEAWCAAHRSLR